MKLIRKWHPEDAPYIDNPTGPKVYRIVALTKDDTFTHYVTFYDTWTGKVYSEIVTMLHGRTNFDHTQLRQIESDQEWGALIEYLQNDSVQVLQMVQEGFEVDKETKEVTLHTGLSDLPRTPYGVDTNGSQIVTSSTPLECQISPSLVNEDGSILS